METSYLGAVNKQFEYYKLLGDKVLNRLSNEELFYTTDAYSNSVAIIVKHISGNMLSRWTDFLNSDGEKEWRNRDDEFETTKIKTKEDVISIWEKGWDCLLTTLHSLKEEDLKKIIYIRNQGHTVVEAINRQLAHYPYHVGQMVFLAKVILGEKWDSLSIPKNQSKAYNSDKFSKEKSRKHFTDEYLK